jgi:hypothetical protein
VVWISAFPDIKFAHRAKERSVKECDKAGLLTVHTLRTQTNLSCLLGSYRTVNTLNLLFWFLCHAFCYMFMTDQQMRQLLNAGIKPLRATLPDEIFYWGFCFLNSAFL